MNLVQLTPGAGRMYCGNCLRDNALVRMLRQQGHTVTMVPLYLPLTLDEADESAATPIFFSGVNVYLDQKLPWFRSAPEWVRKWFTGRGLLGGVGRFAARTRAEKAGDLALSMLRGEAGNQARDLEELVGWLRTQPAPDAFCLSNALLLGMAHGLKAAFNAPVLCLLAGEDAFLDAMPARLRDQAWQLMAEQARHVDRFLAPTRYFADRMTERLRLDPDRISVLPGGVSLEGLDESAPVALPTPTIGFLARMCRDKGLDTLVEAYILLRRRNRVPEARLKVGGSCGPTDEPLVNELKAKLHAAGFRGETSFHPNLSRDDKIAFLRSLSVFSVPALYGEAFGLYLVEALAAGVPVVQPRHAAFPEIIEITGGGVLCEPGSPESLAEALESLLLDEPRRRAMAAAASQAVRREFSSERTAAGLLSVIEGLRR
ncbi:MAG: glycosyltransferase family 4 protein [Verrucomicrobiales bacterium]|nr:glycosyltransferase family 4 protein [Verrucomicrobiales bacterium]MCP5525759.1 glycosyltransferase family 4 protein [Verrucomicrobiales bacterium]